MFSDTTKTAADVTGASAEHDLKSKVDAVKSSAKKIYDDVNDEIGHYADDADGRIRDLTQKARGRINDAKDRLNSAKDRLNDRINDKPVPSAAIALGVGLVLGLLMAGRRSRY